jgi:hypothetical protein
MMAGSKGHRQGVPILGRLLVALAVVAIPYAAVAALSRRLAVEEGCATVSAGNFRRVGLGMTRSAVEAILGKPPMNPGRAYRFLYRGGAWNYTGSPSEYPSFSDEDLADFRPVSTGGTIAVWPGEGPTAILVEFDGGGAVFGAAYLEGGVPKPTVKDRLAKWLGL